MRYSSQKKKLLLIGCWLGIGFWILESAIMALIFHEGEFLTQLLAPDIHEVWQRILVLVFIFGFAFHADFLLAKRKRAYDALRESEDMYHRRNMELSALQTIANAVSQTHGLEEILNVALKELLSLELFGGKAKGMLFLLEEGNLRLVSHHGAPPNHPCLTKPLDDGECLCGMVAKTGELVISSSAKKNEKHTRHWQAMESHEDICMPLKVRGKMLEIGRAHV